MKSRISLSVMLLSASLLQLACSASDSEPDRSFQVPDAATPQVLAGTVDRSAPELVWGNQLVHAVWSEKRDNSPTSTSDIWYGSAPVGGDFTATPQRITNTPEESAQPSLAIDSNGDVQLVWVEGIGNARTIQGVFVDSGTVGTISALSASGNNSDPRVAFDGAGSVHIVWDQGDTIAYKNGSAAPLNLPQTAASSAAGKPDLCVLANGRVMAVWEAKEVSNGIAFDVLRLALSTANSNPVTFGADNARLQVVQAGHFAPRVRAGDENNEAYILYRVGSTTAAQRKLQLSRMVASGSSQILSHQRDIVITNGTIGAASLSTQVISSNEEIYCAWVQQGDLWVRSSIDGEGRTFGLAREDFGTMAYDDGTVQGNSILALDDKLVVGWSARATNGTVRAIMAADVDISIKNTTN